ncbi:phosphatidylinositol-4- kinase [Coniosporium apollinis]|uniref:1-phosphatidylinositol 4-kinase n=1 Tax=Coniosporium apollinis TaxID=61459 RepID=A0ABQ9P2D5_9PEZI|nr:phosphatidylinositol-4- kinase [Coniosporium apollinis]
MRTLRRDALEKLAALSARSPKTATGHSDLTRLCKTCPQTSTVANGYGHGGSPSRPGAASVAMSLPELEVLLALCKAAPSVQNLESAHQLLQQISPYLPESHVQAIKPSSSVRELDPSPWETLTFQLTSALLSLGLNHTSLRRNAAATIEDYIEAWSSAAATLSAEQFDGDDTVDFRDDGALSRVVTLAMSLLGFIEAAAQYACFWTPRERLQVIESLRGALSEKFVVALETALSVIRNARSSQHGLREWKRHTKHYAATGRPLGVMLLRQAFTRLIASSASLLVAPSIPHTEQSVLDVLRTMKRVDLRYTEPIDEELLFGLAEIAADELRLLEEGSDYLQIGSAWQQRLACAVKAYSLTSFLCCSIVDEEVAEPDILITWLEATVTDPVQLADENLASVVFKCMSVLAKTSSSIAATLSRFLPRVIVQGGFDGRTASVAADCLGSILKLLPQDTVIATLYSLGNVLSAGAERDRAATSSPFADGTSPSRTQPNGGLYKTKTGGSAISLAPSDIDEPSVVYATVIQTIVSIATSCTDEKITALALSMLIQKVGRVSVSVDAKIITESAFLGAGSGESEFRSLLKLYDKLAHDALIQNNSLILEAVMTARNHLSRSIKREKPSFGIYVIHLLETIISKGDAHEKHNRYIADSDLAAQEIGQLLSPLALVVSLNISTAGEKPGNDSIIILQRDAWFNIVVHGFDLTTPLGQKHTNELRVLAQYSQPLVAEDRADQLESDIELNVVLRRGKGAEQAVDQKKHLIELLPSCEPYIRSISYPEAVFLNAANLVESLRASSGDCTKSLIYFLDPKLRNGPMGNIMTAITLGTVKTYLSRTLAGNIRAFSAPYLARQLSIIFSRCCHRISRVQQVAYSCADLIINSVPSALCQKTSLFALLELLTLMWSSCLEGETDEYEWTAYHASAREDIAVELSDDYSFRRSTLLTFQKHAKEWVGKVLNVAPLDIKGFLQTYLSEVDDDNAYGHVALGRSFALEMGSAIPSTDQRLGAIDQQRELHINTASDFVSQYTTRQEYRLVDCVQDQQEEWTRPANGTNLLVRRTLGLIQSMEDATKLLQDLEARTFSNRDVPIAELRDALRRAAALLCRARTDQSAIVHHLVGIPFAVFSKQAIKLGISLWTSVIKENPRMQSRILVEIVEQWEATVHNKRGFFDDSHHHSDPFYVKQEFAPTDKAAIQRQHQRTHNMIAPHFRLLQFFSSHFNATRLGSPHIEKIYNRLMQVTLEAMPYTSNHPLAREVHFHIVLLGLRVLRFSTDLSAAMQWRLKDRILSAALVWFSRQPKWSFGGNRLQVKAETHILADIQAALQDVAAIGIKPNATLKSLQTKQDLLLMLLANEQSRLMVWLFPLDYEKKHYFTSGQHSKEPAEGALTLLLKTAWAEDPALAVQLAHRFPSAKLTSEVRWLILNFPGKITHEPDALEILLGNSLPSDVSFQLKYLLYWAPVNPITAVTYFLPAYGNHPFIIQYAMRALESHSVDVTFFYVPQIVQTLRYDVLGYVERYIIETAKFSQLFAHQIIWNMKANAYKDEDSQIPDPVKPTLDKVMDALISSFGKEDKAFYEREFSFFNEVTGISGKLRPFIKRPKPEKKQKIEEELRKIKVEVGVYLPSNPDGVVIGIDRKSGKPLQSHAKAPYMATFRIRKEKGDVEEREEKLSRAADGSRENTYEVWQSAIFKVGDDCRQDVLALQMIAAFRGIFHNVGLDVYVNPYRVTATAPGCGVIDVLPNSISRDMLGREAVNGLFEYFVSKYGGEDSIRFQEARTNFVKSMAAYSIISYLLQFKDRHNGNIMIDDAGHILHIDFGFCFDIAPGGIKFERAPFKLTSEMVAVMGGSTTSQPYRWFEELCIKAFLASRQHCEHLVHMVVVMLDSGLPCFKPETVQHFRERFVLERNERDAADFVKDLIKKSYSSHSTKTYDQFQLLTNGIPY